MPAAAPVIRVLLDIDSCIDFLLHVSTKWEVMISNLAVLFVSIVGFAMAAEPSPDLRIWMDRPAQAFTQSLAIVRGLSSNLITISRCTSSSMFSSRVSSAGIPLAVGAVANFLT